MHSLREAHLLTGKVSLSSEYNQHNRNSHRLLHFQMWASSQTKTLWNKEEGDFKEVLLHIQNCVLSTFLMTVSTENCGYLLG